MSVASTDTLGAVLANLLSPESVPDLFIMSERIVMLFGKQSMLLSGEKIMRSEMHGLNEWVFFLN